ncbi:MAG TPA: ATP-binding protein [Azospirillaceae bacterium]|nr:ATP-binding protein [Azospirillaceae bacterium]
MRASDDNKLRGAVRKTSRTDRLQAELAAAHEELRRRMDEIEEARRQVEETQANLIQAERMAALGGLVAGVAHEINTPVGITLTAASHLADRTTAIRRLFEDGRIRKADFEEFIATATEASTLILANASRAAELIQSFKQVAADQTSAERRAFELKPFIQEVLLSLSPKVRQAGHTVTVDCPDGIRVDGFPGAFSQVITNFVMNSLQHAYQDGRAGYLSLSVRESAPGLLELRYTDDGCGITRENLPRIFDPFFTTRRGTGGTGLGLHIVSNIVTDTLKGGIEVETTAGGGTSFVVTFPRVIQEG